MDSADTSRRSLVAEFYCVNCAQGGGSRCDYEDGQLVRVECLNCHYVIDIDHHAAQPRGETQPSPPTGHRIEVAGSLAQIFSRTFLRRVLTQPHEVSREYLADLDWFLVVTSLRVVTKPYRVAGKLWSSVRR